MQLVCPVCSKEQDAEVKEVPGGITYVCTRCTMQDFVSAEFLELMS